MNVSTCPWSFCSGDVFHERIIRFVEHVSESSSPSHTTASPEGDSTNPVEYHIIQYNYNMQYQNYPMTQAT